MRGFLHFIFLGCTVALSPYKNGQDIMNIEPSASLLDQLYGELVDSKESREHKFNCINEGKVSITKNNAGKSDFVEDVNYKERFAFCAYQTMNDLIRISETQQRTSRMNAHEIYLTHRSSIKFPENDDTSDLFTGGVFGGIITFGGFKTMQCFNSNMFDHPIDIAIVGAPFDTGTSYRPGARFGPEAIRLGARRLHEGVTPVRGNGPNSKLRKVNPYDSKSHNFTIIDCGDVPMTPFDNRFALNQLYRAERAIHKHSTSGKVDIPLPKIITIGGDHTITLMALRLAYEKYGRIAVLHFDSHIDTWNPKILGGGYSDYMSLNHGTFLHYAAENGYLEPGKCFHLGLRAPYILSTYDQKHDRECGFNTITARDLDDMGKEKIVTQIKETVGETPVYVSVDIDVLDPSTAPGTGTMEIGGWTGRELLTVLDALEGLNIIGGDVVEVSPPYDTNSEVTSLAATAIIDSLLGLLIVQSI